jgi:two-component system NarL family sensor kinase
MVRRARDDWRVSVPAASSRVATVATLALTVALLAATAGIWLVERSSPDVLESSFLPAMVVASVSFASLGALIRWHVAPNRIGSVLVALGLVIAVATVSAQYGGAVVVGGHDWPGGRWALWLSSWIWVIGLIPTVTLLPLLFPDGRLGGRRRFVALAAAAATLGIVVTQALAPWDDLFEQPVGAQNPLGSNELPAVVSGVAAVLLLASVIASVVSVAGRHRRAEGLERLQLTWFASAALLLPIGIAMSTQLPPDIGWLGEAVAIPALAGATAVAVLRYRLYGIEIIVRRSLVVGAVAVVSTALYAAAVLVTRPLFHGRDWVPAAIATGLVAVAFQYIRQQAVAGVDRLLYGERGNPRDALTRLVRSVDADRPDESPLRSIVETLHATLRLPWATIEMRGAAVATAGHPTGRSQRIPLLYQGEDIGGLVCGLAADERELAERDVRTLTDLAAHIAVVAHSIQISDDLQRSRRESVVALEEERRRLRRDLHDGLGPHLAGISLSVAAGRNMLDEPTKLDELLSRIDGQLHVAIGEVRDVLEGLRPPALDQIGLAETLRQDVAALSCDGLRVELDIDDELPALAAATEVAVLRIVSEALTNVVKHASATSCRVVVTADDALVVTIADDGVGLDEGWTAGVGLTSMRGRAAEVGGSLALERAPGGGLAVRAFLPLDHA